MRRSDIRRARGRPAVYHEATMARVRRGVLARIEQAPWPWEGQGDFIRTAVDNELKAREASKEQFNAVHRSQVQVL